MAEKSVSIFSLKTENITHPVGIDLAHPRFSWKIKSDFDNFYQGAYRIQVRDEKDKIVWDTGKVLSNMQNEILYEGTPLRSETEYCWQVKIWDGKENSWDFSEKAYFETGIMEDSSWNGEWIGENSKENPLEGLSWIGCTAVPGSSVDFCCTFWVDEPLQQAVFDGTGVESWELFCNGKLWRRMNVEWKQSSDDPIRYADLTQWLKKGKNVLIFRVAADKNGKAAAIGKLVLRDISGKETVLATDEQWMMQKDGTKTKAEILGYYGMEPYGKPKRRGPAPLLRKEFSCDGDILRARLYVCGLGYAFCTINGKKVSDTLLNTEYSQYNKTVYYRIFDVTGLLQNGKNCIGAELGRGYYSFFRDWVGVMEEQDDPKLLLQLVIWKKDSTKQIIKSDKSWKTVDGPTVDDSIWYGEKYDARKCPKGWNLAGYDDAKWKEVSSRKAPGGTLRASIMPPIRVTEERSPAAVSEVSSNVRVYDFGKVVSGNARISVKEPRGTRIKLTYGETLLKNGRVDMESRNRVLQFWEPGQEDIYICSGEEAEVWSPKFSYKGYRYIEVEGIDHKISIVGEVFHNDLERTGYFRCSNKLFNRIHELITPTILNNFHSIPTDTPAYEKRGWTGDGQSICDTALRNVDAQPFWEKWMQDLLDSQQEDGAIPDTCPGPLYYPPAPEWMCAVVVIPYQLYLHCGNRRILEKCYPQMERYMQYEIGRLQDGMSSNRFYGDWNSPAGSRPPEGTSYNATCFVYRTLKMMEEIATVLGKKTKAETYKRAASDMRKVLNERFFDERERLYHGDVLCGFRQTPTVLPLAFGIAPEEMRIKIAESLADHIWEKDKGHLSTGCMGLKFLAPALTEYSQAEMAYTIVNQTDFPSWGYWLTQGATTCWEEWSTGTRSFDHFYFGTVDDWFYQYLAGIRPVEAGYRCFAVKPYPCGDVSEVECKIETVYGKISVHWKLEANKFCLTVLIPPNTTAKIYMPTGVVYSAGSGKHCYTVIIHNEMK